jgi:prolyl 4-hydroxylase
VDNHGIKVSLVLLIAFVSIGTFCVGSQQELLPVLRSHLPNKLRAYLPTAVWEATTTSESQEPLNTEGLVKVCSDHQYTTEIISLDPLLIYINNFTSAREAAELIRIGYVYAFLFHRLHSFCKSY